MMYHLYFAIGEPNFSDLYCNSVKALSGLFPSSGDFKFINFISQAVETTPFLGKAIVADLAFQLQKILYLVVFYKFLQIMPFKF